MTAPAVSSNVATNGNLIGIQARGMSGGDETAYKAALAADYQHLYIQASQGGQVQFANTLIVELNNLNALTDGQLAALPRRGY